MTEVYFIPVNNGWERSEIKRGRSYKAATIDTEQNMILGTFCGDSSTFKWTAIGEGNFQCLKIGIEDEE